MKLPLTILACLLVAQTPALASPRQALPPGNYLCADRGIVFDRLELAGNSYLTQSGKQGKFTYNHRKVKARTGPLRGWRGKWYWNRLTYRRVAEMRLRKGKRVVFCARIGGRA